MKTKPTSKITSNAAAPAAKPAAPARKKAAAPAKPAAAPVIAITPVPDPAVPAAAPVARPAPAPTPVAVKPAAPAKAKLPETIISVKVDVGFGNQLYIRGEGAGLSWDKGVPAETVASDLWKIALTGAAQPVKFKVLVNDTTWSAGEDFAVEPGQCVTLTPAF
jgi:hypothetical protein